MPDFDIPSGFAARLGWISKFGRLMSLAAVIDVPS
jgi:hypothetical protein